MNEKQDPESEQLVDSISKVDFISGKRDSNQYIFPIMRVLRREGFRVMSEKPITKDDYRSGYINIHAKKGNTVICVEIDYKTVKRNSIRKISGIWKAIPIFVLTHEGEANIRESLERIDLPIFFLIDLYNHSIFSQKDKKD
jgi:hypothetical protein